MDTRLIALMADAILIVHGLFVLFIILGLAAIYIGRARHWAWVKNRSFRILHLLAIVVVVIQSWLGVICPLTTWEMTLRERAQESIYSGSFIQHWLHKWLYYSAPEWVFILAYTVFGGLVIASWYIVRPASRGK